MNKLSTRVAVGLIAIWSVSLSSGIAATYALNSPGDITNPTTLLFDGFPHLTTANNLYQGQGITFSRDDGQPVFIYDWASLNRTTPSPPDVLATVADFHLTTTYVTHLNVLSSHPLMALGAWFGNDQGDPDYSSTRLSVFGSLGQLLGSVQIAVNNNTSVDQFIGIGSDIPFFSARFENLNSSGQPSGGYSVVIDNLSFAQVPEPGMSSLLGVFLLASLFLLRRRGVEPAINR